MGKRFSHGEIEFRVNESFYKEQKITEKELAKLLEEADSINLVGEKSVGVALQNNWVKKEDIIRIDEKVPHVQIFKI